jgi:hypothetical protein
MWFLYFRRIARLSNANYVVTGILLKYSIKYFSQDTPSLSAQNSYSSSKRYIFKRFSVNCNIFVIIHFYSRGQSRAFMSVFSSQSSLSSQPSQVHTVIMYRQDSRLLPSLAVKRIKISYVDCRFLLPVSLACNATPIKGTRSRIVYFF